MASLIQDWVTNPGNNQGLKLSCATNLNLRLASSEYGLMQYRPELEVVYTTPGAGDTTPPTMTIGSPSSGPASSSPITVTGTASDPGGVAQVTWSNGLTGQNGTATGTTAWTATIPLAPGSNDITISVTDSAGNMTTSTLTMTGAGPGATTAVGSGGDDDKSCGFGSVSPVGAPIFWLAGALALLLMIRRR